jgi:hypothetical protein
LGHDGQHGEPGGDAVLAPEVGLGAGAVVLPVGGLGGEGPGGLVAREVVEAAEEDGRVSGGRVLAGWARVLERWAAGGRREGKGRGGDILDLHAMRG